MDSISRPEFAGIFDRVTMDVDLKGCTSAIQIGNYLKIARHYAKTKSKESKWEFNRRAYGFKAEEFDKLLEYDFAGRVISEAQREPKGIVALTLIHGRQMAQQRILAQKRAALRWVLAQRGPGVPGIPRRPEFRRIPTHRR